jgi:hypothetical protein
MRTVEPSAAASAGTRSVTRMLLDALLVALGAVTAFW